MKKIFVFTGGGLAPALNPTLYGVISSAKEKGWQVFGGLFGWASLLPGGKYIDLSNVDISSIKDVGGTFLRSSRTNPFSKPDGIEQIKKRLAELKIDAVVAVGGDDTLGAAAKLFMAGVPIVGIPKTIDNDLFETYFTPGFPSAAHYLSSYVKEIREDAAYALSRIYVIESLGMKAGWLAASAIYGHADIIIPPEREINWDHFIKLLKKRYTDNGNYATVVISQEANFDKPLEVMSEAQPGEQYGHTRKHFICLSLKDKIKKELGIETKALYPGNYIETGKPIELDKKMSIELGQTAINLISENKFGFAPCVLRPDAKDIKLIIKPISLDKVSGNGKFRPMPDEYFDLVTLLPTQKFTEYMKPILGVYQPSDDEYTKLIKKITSQS